MTDPHYCEICRTQITHRRYTQRKRDNLPITCSRDCTLTHRKYTQPPCTICGSLINPFRYRRLTAENQPITCSDDCTKNTTPTRPCVVCGNQINASTYNDQKHKKRPHTCSHKCARAYAKYNNAPLALQSIVDVETLRWYYTTEDYRDFVKACREGSAA